MKHRIKLHTPGRSALWILRLGLPMVVIEGIAILISYLEDRKIDAVLANDTWATALSDLLTAVIVAVGLAILADAIEADLQKRNQS